MFIFNISEPTLRSENCKKLPAVFSVLLSNQITENSKCCLLIYTFLVLTFMYIFNYLGSSDKYYLKRCKFVSYATILNSYYPMIKSRISKFLQ